MIQTFSKKEKNKIIDILSIYGLNVFYFRKDSDGFSYLIKSYNKDGKLINVTLRQVYNSKKIILYSDFKNTRIDYFLKYLNEVLKFDSKTEEFISKFSEIDKTIDFKLLNSHKQTEFRTFPFNPSILSFTYGELNLENLNFEQNFKFQFVFSFNDETYFNSINLFKDEISLSIINSNKQERIQRNITQKEFSNILFEKINNYLKFIKILNFEEEQITDLSDLNSKLNYLLNLNSILEY